VTTLLLDVRVEIDRQHEDALNEWYHLHVPRLLSFPGGYSSGRRYLRLAGGPKYAALYEIRDRANVRTVLGADHSLREPITVAEWVEWDERFVPHVSHFTSNLYEAAEQEELIVGDFPIVEARFDTESISTLDYCDNVLLPRLRELRGIRRADRLRAPADPELEWLKTTPKNLILVQVEDPDTARSLATDMTLSSLPEEPHVEVVAYQQIARHWPFFVLTHQPDSN